MNDGPQIRELTHPLVLGIDSRASFDRVTLSGLELRHFQVILWRVEQLRLLLEILLVSDGKPQPVG